MLTPIFPTLPSCTLHMSTINRIHTSIPDTPGHPGLEYLPLLGSLAL